MDVDIGEEERSSDSNIDFYFFADSKEPRYILPSSLIHLLRCNNFYIWDPQHIPEKNDIKC